MSPESYSPAAAIRDFTAFVLDAAAAPGWEARLARRWAEETARLAAHLDRGPAESGRTALNYVYGYRTALRSACAALPAGDPRRVALADPVALLPTPGWARAAQPRRPLAAAVAGFAARAAALARQGAGARPALEALWEAELDRMSERTVSTRKSYISRYRKACVLQLAADPAEAGARARALLLDVVCHPPELVRAVNAAYERKLHADTRNQVVITEWRALVAAFRRCLGAPNPRLQMIGVMALTGRRFYEVAVSGQFAPVVETLPGGAQATARWALRFSGQAKTRGAEGTRAGRAYTIPCLAPAPGILAAMAAIRDSAEGRAWRGMDAYALNARVSNQINRYLRTRTEFAGLWPAEEKLTVKCLRAFYAEVAYRSFAPGTIEKAPYYAQILGHSETDLHTALSYMDYRLDLDGREAVRRDMQRLIDREDP